MLFLLYLVHYVLGPYISTYICSIFYSLTVLLLTSAQICMIYSTFFLLYSIIVVFWEYPCSAIIISKGSLYSLVHLFPHFFTNCPHQKFTILLNIMLLIYILDYFLILFNLLCFLSLSLLIPLSLPLS